MRRWMVDQFLKRSDATPRGTGPDRDQFARQLALATLVILLFALALPAGTSFLMPGPLASSHASIGTCISCHANSGSTRVSWLHGLVAGEQKADSKACLTCHRTTETAFKAHGLADERLKKSTDRLLKIASQTSPPLPARVQSLAFPAAAVRVEGLACATCHQEHQGGGFDLKKMSNDACGSCHVVKFDSFEGGHPVFENYPFRRRTRIIYDHAGHFNKHYPEVAKKDATKSIPTTCASCHDSSTARQVMGVKPFDQTCSGCHLDQIVGKERVSGPKGIAFLSLPGLDVESLRNKKVAIGEWPEDSEAALTPFMKVLIGQSDRGRSLLTTLEGVNLQDLASASDPQVKAVADLVWEIKRLFHALISGEAPEIFAKLTPKNATPSVGNLVAALTAQMPLDVIEAAQRQWLPNLAREISERPQRADLRNGHLRNDELTNLVRLAALEAETLTDAAPFNMRPAAKLFDRMAQAETEQTLERRELPSGTPRSIEGRSLEGVEIPGSSGGTGKSSGSNGSSGQSQIIPLDAPPTPSAAPAEAGPQTDDLLSPTAAEQREIDAQKGGPAATSTAASKAAPPPLAPGETRAGPVPGSQADPASGGGSGTAAEAASQADAGGAIDAENWARTGGWYRQDYAIFYRPAGHKDLFFASWLKLTAPQAPRNGAGPAVAVFNALAGKDAQGACTKCHSVDDVEGGGRLVNFSPLTAKDKKDSFTRFAHEPHFTVTGDRGCLSCHGLQSGKEFLKTYEAGKAHSFTPGFSMVKKETCKTCHQGEKAPQDCSQCHTYHIGGMTTPMMTTRNPTP